MKKLFFPIVFLLCGFAAAQTVPNVGTRIHDSGLVWGVTGDGHFRADTATVDTGSFRTITVETLIADNIIATDTISGVRDTVNEMFVTEGMPLIKVDTLASDLDEIYTPDTIRTTKTLMGDVTYPDWGGSWLGSLGVSNGSLVSCRENVTNPGAGCGRAGSHWSRVRLRDDPSANAVTLSSQQNGDSALQPLHIQMNDVTKIRLDTAGWTSGAAGIRDAPVSVYGKLRVINRNSETGTSHTVYFDSGGAYGDSIRLSSAVHSETFTGLGIANVNARILAGSAVELERNAANSFYVAISHANSAGFYGYATGGTKAAPSATLDAQQLNGLGARGYTTGYTGTAGGLFTKANGLWSAGNSGATTYITGTPSGSTTAATWVTWGGTTTSGFQQMIGTETPVNGMRLVVVGGGISAPASTTSYPSIRIPAGVRPTSPTAGDTYYSSAYDTLYTYSGSAWKYLFLDDE